jgi:FKBP-type peptidyl-prolyl cis-trans isomerase
MLRNWAAILVFGAVTVQLSAQDAPVLKTDQEKQSYAVGVDLARNLKRKGIAADPDALAKGVHDALAGAKLLMTEEELREALNLFQTATKLKLARNIYILGSENKQAGEAFLAANKAKEDVVTLPSGLQYKIIKTGDGKKPAESDTVDCRYRGTLLDGTEFDNSYRTGKDAAVKVAGAIPGWKEALQLMPVGSKWQLFIPSELAYGQKGSGRYIGPNATLFFELELVAIK